MKDDGEVPETTKSDNELIAEFMWLVFIKEIDGIKYYNVPNYNVPKGTFNMHNASMGYFLYHKSWAWLMPVVEKITGIPYESEEVDNGFGVKVTVVQRPYLRTFGMINDENGHYMARFNRCALHMAPTLIEATYSAVVDFIKIYNQQKP